MAELTFRSPGVSTREIDLSGPRVRVPQGTPAGVIGTANRGPAFVPVTFPSMNDFVAKFGETDGTKFGPLAMNEWFKNAQAGTYLRVLGAGDGLRRTSSGDNAGMVTNAGFVVGGELPQANGFLGNNAYTPAPVADATDTDGRTYFLAAFMSESVGSTIFQDAGLVLENSNRALPILRGVLMAPSGVILGLNATNLPNNVPLRSTAASVTRHKGFGPNATDNGGSALGSVDLGDVITPNPFKHEFIMLINGLNNDGVPNALTASFDPVASNYFGDVFNTDPTKIEEKGHYLYRQYDIYRAQAVVTGSGIMVGGPTGSTNYAAILVTGSLARNVGSTTVPNFDGFEDRFKTAFSTFVISQEFGGADKNLFKFHALDDGTYPNQKFKISIENIAKSTNSANNYGTFDVVVRSFYDDDRNVQALEQFRGLTLDPTSDRFIAKVIGDQHFYWDFDQRLDGQKLVLEGNYPNGSQYIRVELSSELENGQISDTALPVGFRGPWHLVTSGTSASGATMLAVTGAGGVDGAPDYVASTWTAGIVEPPIPYRKTIAVGTSPKKRVDGQLYWGTQFEPINDLNEPNIKNVPDVSRSPVKAYTNYMPMYQTTWRPALVGDNQGTSNDGSVILDADIFNNNKFTLERVQILTGAAGDVVDPTQWAAATYRRNGVLGSMTSITASTPDYAANSTRTRFLDVAKDFGELASKQFFKFTLFMQGGFDGVNIFDTQKSTLSNLSAIREMLDSDQGGQAGSTVAAYRKALDIMGEKTDADIQLLAIPGIRENIVTDYAIETVEGRFDALYIMDVEELDSLNAVVTSSVQVHNVKNTVTDFKGRALDSSFAAAYYPDVVITDPTTKTNVQVPPSVAVLGVMALNDRVSHPWFAPAGFTRGALDSIVDTQVKLNRQNLDQLYDAKINPIVSFPGQGGPVVFGQKTLLAAQSALDRVNVRRLLIDIRRQVRTIANTFIFEPNREETLARFSAAVTPILIRVQQQQGLDRFKVQIDSSTTTQADVENNTVRGKIYLQPTRSVEFISLDFVVTNAGAQI